MLYAHAWPGRAANSRNYSRQASSILPRSLSVLAPRGGPASAYSGMRARADLSGPGALRACVRLHTQRRCRRRPPGSGRPRRARAAPLRPRPWPPHARRSRAVPGRLHGRRLSLMRARRETLLACATRGCRASWPMSVCACKCWGLGMLAVTPDRAYVPSAPSLLRAARAPMASQVDASPGSWLRARVRHASAKPGSAPARLQTGLNTQGPVFLPCTWSLGRLHKVGTMSRASQSLPTLLWLLGKEHLRACIQVSRGRMHGDCCGA